MATKKKSITFRNITTEEFTRWFSLDSPGYFIAKESHKAGEIESPTDAVEVICLANKFYDMVLFERLVLALKPHGKAKEYVELRGTDAGVELAVNTLGRERTATILREAMAEVRKEVKIGENDKKKPPRRRAG
jgi:hypothetical protein